MNAPKQTGLTDREISRAMDRIYRAKNQHTRANYISRDPERYAEMMKVAHAKFRESNREKLAANARERYRLKHDRPIRPYTYLKAMK